MERGSEEVKRFTEDELLKPYEPQDPVDALYDSLKARRDFERTRGRAKNFKPMKVADCHIARNCGNCWYNKGKVQELSEFSEYGHAFYYGFSVCTIEGREVEKCRITTDDSVCSRHRFIESAGPFRISPRMKTLPLQNIERAIAQRVARAERVAESEKIPCGHHQQQGFPQTRKEQA